MQQQNATATAIATALGTGASPLARPALPASDYRGSILAGWLIVAVTFGGLLLWAVLAPLSTAVISHGSLVVEGSRKVVQHLEGGILRQLLVREGERVEAGQLLVRMDEAQVQASRAMLLVRLNVSLAQEARLMAERDNSAAIAFPSALTTVAHDADVASIMVNQERLFDARRASREGQSALLRNRIEQSRQQIAGLTTLEQSLALQAALMRKELVGQKILGEKGYSAQNKILAIEREVARLEGERGQSLASISQIRQAISEADLQILQLEKVFREDLEKELRDVQAQRYDSEERLIAVNDQIRRLEVRAPVSGTVVDLAQHTEGGVVTPGARIMDIVPDDQRLVVEVKVEPASIDGLVTGRPAEVRFSAFNRGTTPSALGKVVFVSADALLNPRTELSFYTVRVAIDEGSAKDLEGVELTAGMPVEVVINKGQRTLVDYFLRPLKESLTRAMKE